MEKGNIKTYLGKVRWNVGYILILTPKKNPEEPMSVKLILEKNYSTDSIFFSPVKWYVVPVQVLPVQAM